ncbi:BRO family protein [Proteiniborus sp. MB09-C3]|uniref:BRO-N domain-containing protein n=1 Tax=Proteiniborus sp. MB09-C3 TaxID=3050072 RepID=UPI002555B003|nr:BRO family protein [Proteiniborus sp. MB09-C3]WIV11130.1 BRO family protein [Proteiniborus sp. MB09-C3]
MNKNRAIKLTNSIVKDSSIRKIHSTGELFFTESRVYKLVFRSNKPKAEKFTDWVTDEVLPAIRKEGKYVVEPNSSIEPKNNIIQLHKKKLEKAVITSNYLIDYINSVNGQMPENLLNSFTTAIQAVNIDIIDYLKNMNKIKDTKSHQ